MYNKVLDKFRSNIRRVFIVILSLIGSLFVYVSYIQVYQANSLSSNPLNRRGLESAHRIEQGSILDRNGKKLATSIPDEAGGYKRIYPFGPVTAHITGYSSSEYGKSGIEGQYTGYLTGTQNPERKLGPIAHLFDVKQGNNIVLTLDYTLQETAYKALGNRRGAVVAISPRTGEILAMVSKPSFDPNYIDRDWKSISQSVNSPLLNRAMQGLYPPGSIIKIMIAEAAISEKVIKLDDTFNCTGLLKIGKDYTLNENNSVAHGKVDLEDALTVSCNVAFGQLSIDLGRIGLEKTFNRYGFSKSTDSGLEDSISRLPDFRNLSDGEVAQTGIGQGSLLVTPLRMAMLASCFANNGPMFKPHLVSKIIAPDGVILEQSSPSEWLSPVDPKVANEVKRMMISVVQRGTGTAAKIPGIQVAGKTGTAENPLGAAHAWFIGFAPADNPQIAIAVIVENGGGGGQIAAPIARMVFEQALR